MDTTGYFPNLLWLFSGSQVFSILCNVNLITESQLDNFTFTLRYKTQANSSLTSRLMLLPFVQPSSRSYVYPRGTR